MDLPFREDDADWIKVLEVIYEYQMESEGPLVPGSGKSQKMLKSMVKHQVLRDETGLNSEDLVNKIEYLRSVRMIQDQGIALSSKGFQLIHQRKMERRQWWTNVILSTGIITVSVLTLLI